MFYWTLFLLNYISQEKKNCNLDITTYTILIPKKSLGHYVKCHNWMQWAATPFYCSKTRYLTFNLINFTVFRNILNFMPAPHIKKLGREHVCHFVTSPFLLVTLSKTLWREVTNCWSSENRILSLPFFDMTSAAQQSEVFTVVFCTP